MDNEKTQSELIKEWVLGLTAGTPPVLNEVTENIISVFEDFKEKALLEIVNQKVNDDFLINNGFKVIYDDGYSCNWSNGVITLCEDFSGIVLDNTGELIEFEYQITNLIEQNEQ